MAIQEILGRYNTDSGYDYFYMHTPFEVVTPAAAVTNVNGVYNIPTKVPTAHYIRPMLVVFKAPVTCVDNQKVSINGGKAMPIQRTKIPDIYQGDIVLNDVVVLYIHDLQSSAAFATLLSVNGQTVDASYFSNFLNMSRFPFRSYYGDTLWKDNYTWASTTAKYSELNIYEHDSYSGSTSGTVYYPKTPRQVYYATATSKSGSAYSVTLGEFPLSKRSGANKYGVMFIARFANPSTGNDTITVDGTNYGRIQIGTSAVNRGLFANEIKANQTCTFQINQDGKIYLLFIDGRAATGAGSTITLSNPSSPPLNPLAGDEWLQIVKVVSP